jgi:hypothetical protein
MLAWIFHISWAEIIEVSISGILNTARHGKLASPAQDDTGGGA